MKSQSLFVYSVLSLTLVSQSLVASVRSPAQNSQNPQFSYSPVNNCNSRPRFLTQPKVESVAHFEQLPKALYVAKEAEYYVEGNSEMGKPIQAYSVQSFDSKSAFKNPEIVCGEISKDESRRFTMQAPTIIDSTKNQKVGNTFWQFQMLSKDKELSAWNLKSPSLSNSKELEKTLKDFKATYKIYQLSHNEFEVLLSKQELGTQHYLMVKYQVY